MRAKIGINIYIYWCNVNGAFDKMLFHCFNVLKHKQTKARFAGQMLFYEYILWCTIDYLRNSESHWGHYGIIFTSQAAPPMRWWGCLAGQYNAMGPEVRFSVCYFIHEHCFTKRTLSYNNVLLDLMVNVIKSISHCTKQCRNIRIFKKCWVPFSRSILGANNDRCNGRYKNNTDYGEITPGADI